MHRPQLEHIIRAATGITGTTEFVIVGSQAVLGQFPEAPDEGDFSGRQDAALYGRQGCPTPHFQTASQSFSCQIFSFLVF